MDCLKASLYVISIIIMRYIMTQYTEISIVWHLHQLRNVSANNLCIIYEPGGGALPIYGMYGVCYVTDCVNDGKYVPPDIRNSLGCTKSVLQV